MVKYILWYDAFYMHWNGMLQWYKYQEVWFATFTTFKTMDSTMCVASMEWQWLFKFTSTQQVILWSKKSTCTQVFVWLSVAIALYDLFLQQRILMLYQLYAQFGKETSISCWKPSFVYIGKLFVQKQLPLLIHILLGQYRMDNSRGYISSARFVKQIYVWKLIHSGYVYIENSSRTHEIASC